MIRLLIGWLVLLGLLGVLLLACVVPLGRWAPLVFVPALAMVATLGVVFMRLRESSALAQAFAVAGVLWLAILIGLAGVDRLTRADVAAPVTRFP